jgi:hypothetical protein
MSQDCEENLLKKKEIFTPHFPTLKSQIPVRQQIYPHYPPSSSSSSSGPIFSPFSSSSSSLGHQLFAFPTFPPINSVLSSPHLSSSPLSVRNTYDQRRLLKENSLRFFILYIVSLIEIPHKKSSSDQKNLDYIAARKEKEKESNQYSLEENDSSLLGFFLFFLLIFWRLLQYFFSMFSFPI